MVGERRGNRGISLGGHSLDADAIYFFASAINLGSRVSMYTGVSGNSICRCISIYFHSHLYYICLDVYTCRSILQCVYLVA